MRKILKKSSQIKKAYGTKSVLIVSAKRTPIGSFGGKLASFKATELGALAIRSIIADTSIAKSEVQEVYMGNVLSANLGQAPARQAATNGGLPVSTVCTTVNKMCASGLKSVMLGAQAIRLGDRNCVMAGGFESMSNAPYYLDKARFGYRLGNGSLVDSILKDGLTDGFTGDHMGLCAEKCSFDYNLSREDQDKYAIESYKRSSEAAKSGKFKDEIFSIAVKNRKGITYVSEDEEFTNVKLEKIPSLRTVFKKDGTVTAANASTLNDGAAALLLMSEEKAKKGGYKPLARILGYADAEQEPINFTTAPAAAIPLALKHAGIQQANVDFWEINEAFSAVALANQKILKINPEALNVNGGAVSLGHPIGASGARILTTLINVLKQNRGKVGVAAICNGGGGASAVVIENL